MDQEVDVNGIIHQLTSSMILEQIKVSVETSSLVLNNILQQFQSMIMIPLRTFAKTTEEAMITSNLLNKVFL